MKRARTTPSSRPTGHSHAPAVRRSVDVILMAALLAARVASAQQALADADKTRSKPPAATGTPAISPTTVTILPDVVVSGSGTRSYNAPKTTVGKVSLAPREVPQSLSVLTRQQMDDQDMVTITEAMQQTTGVTVIANDTLSNQYLVRGYTPGVMYDGISSYNGFTPSHQFDLALYERIEVLRGPAGLLRGSGEPGGVVNLVKKRPKKDFAFSGEVGYGSWDNKRLTGDITGPLNAEKTLRGRLVVSNEKRSYFYDHTNSEKYLGMGVVETDLTPTTTLSLSFAGQDHSVRAPWSGLPASSVADTSGHYPLLDVDRSTFNAPDWGRMQYHTEEAAAGIEHRFDNEWKLQAKVNHRVQRQYYKYAYTSSGVDPLTGKVNYSSLQGDYHYTRDGGDLYANGPFRLFNRTHNLLVGLTAETYTSQGKSGSGPKYSGVQFGDVSSLTEPSINYTSGTESQTYQRGLYSQLRLSVLDPLTVVLGARSTTFRIKSHSVAPATETAWKDGAKADDKLSLNVGVLYDLTPTTTLYASGADIFVPQTQLKADGGTLDPRVGRQWEVGSKFDLMSGRLSASLAYFLLRDTGRAYADPASPTTTTYYLNAGKVESKGFEAEVTGRITAQDDLTTGYTYVGTRYLDDPKNAGLVYSIQTPRHQFKFWGNHRFNSGVLNGLSAGLGVLSQSKTQSTRGWRDEVVNTGYTVLNGRVGYDIDKRWSVSLLVNNLLDCKYYASVGTPNIYNFYGEPRSFMLTVKAKY